MADKKNDKPSAKKPGGAPNEGNPGDSDSPSPLGEIAQGPSKLEEFLEKNSKVLLLGVLLGVIAVSAWIVISGLRDGKNKKAGAALVAADEISGYRDVMDAYSGTPAAISAELKLAARQWEDGLRNESIETLQALIQAHPKSPVTASARMALANRLVSEERRDEGIKAFEELAADGSARHLQPIALMKLGDLFREDADHEKAREYYSRAKDLYPAPPKPSQGRLLIEARLEMLDITPPALVEPPPPPKPPVRIPFLPDDAPPNVPPLTSPPAGLPGTPTPGFPGSPTPGIPGSPTPGIPGSPTPGIPGSPTPGIPGTPTPGIPGSPTPGIPGTPTPGVPGSPTPGIPGTPTPGVPGTPTPGIPGTPAPDTPDPAESTEGPSTPETDDSESPDGPESPEPAESEGEPEPSEGGE